MNDADRWVELAERAQRVSILAGLIRIRQSERVRNRIFTSVSQAPKGVDNVVSDVALVSPGPGVIVGSGSQLGSFPTRVVGGFKSSAPGAPPSGTVHNNTMVNGVFHGAVQATSSSAGGRVGLSLVEHNRFPKGRW